MEKKIIWRIKRVKLILRIWRRDFLIKLNSGVIFYDLYDLVENESFGEIERLIRLYENGEIKEIKKEIKKIRKIWEW